MITPVGEVIIYLNVGRSHCNPIQQGTAACNRITLMLYQCSGPRVMKLSLVTVLSTSLSFSLSLSLSLSLSRALHSLYTLSLPLSRALHSLEAPRPSFLPAKSLSPSHTHTLS